MNSKELAIQNAIADLNSSRLTLEQEAFLVDWILNKNLRAQPPSYPRPLRQLWVPYFITCNLRVASIVGRTIKSARATVANYETIRAFLKLFKRTRIELGIQYKDMWNIDKTRCALGICTNA
ncbi:hypothetical protein BDW02DRAFT_568901 [Decorospora gaudefroyi]|uniref:HTH CENPB-type domain-containing protein n=1 Tax=Decorospora gaudefroyi TaxID=184978 RepID=A0A6A5KGW0_9PLEO|nr:hypothetical protein BDW02DRAFT_568901 [Decorospora gaudefroyi]